MNRKLLALIIGIIVGALGWAIVPLVSDKFEPFDSERGFYIGQLVSSIIAIILGYKYGLKHLLIYILGIYISSNLYLPIFYFSKVTEYAIYGLFTTLSLCFYPFVFGMAGKVVKVGYMKYNKSLKPGAPQSGAP